MIWRNNEAVTISTISSVRSAANSFSNECSRKEERQSWDANELSGQSALATGLSCWILFVASQRQLVRPRQKPSITALPELAGGRMMLSSFVFNLD